MISGIVTAEQLLEVTGYDRVGDLCRALDQQNIRYHRGKGGKPWTTLDLINAAAGLAPTAAVPAQTLSADDA